MRAHHTVEAVVGGVVGPLDAPDALVLGRVDEQGRLRVVERTTPLTLPARREIGAVLAAPRSVHPWPAVLPANRFGHRSSDDVAYTPTEPNVVVELDADTAFERGRWRHPTRFRPCRCTLKRSGRVRPGCPQRCSGCWWSWRPEVNRSRFHAAHDVASDACCAASAKAAGSA